MQKLALVFAAVLLSCTQNSGTHPTPCPYQVEYKITHLNFYEAQVKLDSSLSAEPSATFQISLLNKDSKGFYLPLFERRRPSKDPFLKFYLVDSRNDSIELISHLGSQTNKDQPYSKYNFSLYLASDDIIDNHKSRFSTYDYTNYLEIYAFTIDKISHGKLVVIDKGNNCIQEASLAQQDKLSFFAFPSR